MPQVLKQTLQTLYDKLISDKLVKLVLRGVWCVFRNFCA